MILAEMQPGKTTKDVRPQHLWKGDYGQTLRITGLDLPSAVAVHFAADRMEEAIPMVGTTTGGNTDVLIPDSLLKIDAPWNYTIHAYVYITDETSGQTRYEIIIGVKLRAGIAAEAPPQDQPGAFDQAVVAVNAAATRAEAAASNAEQSKQEAEDAAEEAAQTLHTAIEEIQQESQDQIALIQSEADQLTTYSDTMSLAIKQQASGHSLHTEDSADYPLVGLTLYGKSVQETTGGAQLYAGKDVTRTWSAADSDVNAGCVQISIDGNDIFKNGAFMSFYSNTDISDAAVVQLMRDDRNNPNWGSLNIVEIKKGLNQVILGPYSFAKGQESAKVQIRKSSFTYTGTFTLSQIFVKAGQNAMNYEPYTGGQPSPAPEYPQEIESVGDSGEVKVRTTGNNLLNPELYADYSEKGITSTVNKDGSLTLTGTLTVTSSSVVHRLGNQINVLDDGETYRISGATAFQIIDTDGNATYSLTVKVDKKSMAQIIPYIQRTVDNYVDGETIYPMLNAGSTALPWEPYTGTTATLPNGLHGLPVTSGGNYTDESGEQWICDTLEYKVDGSGEYVQRVIKAVFNGSEDWRLNNAGTRFYHTVSEAQAAQNTPIMSSHFIGTSWSTNTLNTICIGNGSIPACGISALNFSNVNELKEWLSSKYEEGNPVKIIAPRATPIRTPLTAAQLAEFRKLRTFKPVTNVFTDSIGDIAMEYVADPKTYIDNKFAGLAAQILNQEG